MYLYFMGSDRQLYVQYVHTPHGASTCMQYTNVILLVYLGVYDQPCPQWKTRRLKYGTTDAAGHTPASRVVVEMARRLAHTAPGGFRFWVVRNGGVLSIN